MDRVQVWVRYTHTQLNDLLTREYPILLLDCYSYLIVTWIFYPWITKPNPNPILGFIYL